MMIKYKFLYIAGIDISRDNGPGINEREFVNELTKNHAAEVICVLPYPQYPQIYFNGKIRYVVNHRRNNPFLFIFFVLSTIGKVISLHRRHCFDALISRIDIIPIIPLSLSACLKIPIILKTLAGYSLFSKSAKGKYKIAAKISLPLYKLLGRKVLCADTVNLPFIDWLSQTFGIPRNRLTYVPNGTNTDFFSPRGREESKRILGCQ